MLFKAKAKAKEPLTEEEGEAVRRELEQFGKRCPGRSASSLNVPSSADLPPLPHKAQHSPFPVSPGLDPLPPPAFDELLCTDRNCTCFSFLLLALRRWDQIADRVCPRVNGFTLTRMYSRFLRGVRPGDPVQGGDEEKNEDEEDAAPGAEDGQQQQSSALSAAAAEAAVQRRGAGAGDQRGRGGGGGGRGRGRGRGSRTGTGGEAPPVEPEDGAQGGAGAGQAGTGQQASEEEPQGPGIQGQEPEEGDLCCSPPRCGAMIDLAPPPQALPFQTHGEGGISTGEGGGLG